MDAGAARHYVPPAMSFLLVLSAVFNALTGAFVGVRAPEPVAHQQAPAVATVAETVARKAAPVARPATASTPEAPVVSETPAPALAAPLDTDRLLE